MTDFDQELSLGIEPFNYIQNQCNDLSWVAKLNCRLSSLSKFATTKQSKATKGCIYRSGQRFGAGHIIDILTGKMTEKVSQNGHEKLSTFGLGKDTDNNQWRSIARQLLTRGFIIADHERYGALRLTEKARPLLRSEIQLSLREESRDTKSTSTRNRAQSRKAAMLAADGQAVLAKLRDKRKEIADEQNVPPYVIFHDSTLIEMAEQRPLRLHEMLSITGVGEVKLDRYGDAFLEVIRQHENL